MNPKTILVLNGPGLSRVEEFAEESGVGTLSDIQHACEQLCEELEVTLDFRQSDDQDEVIGWIKSADSDCDAVVINQMGCAERTPVDYARYCDDLEALRTLAVPVTDIHMTNPFRNDPDTFKVLQGPEGKTSLVCGLGCDSYRVAIRAAAKRLAQSEAS